MFVLLAYKSQSGQEIKPNTTEDKALTISLSGHQLSTQADLENEGERLFLIPPPPPRLCCSIEKISNLSSLNNSQPFLLVCCITFIDLLCEAGINISGVIYPESNLTL